MAHGGIGRLQPQLVGIAAHGQVGLAQHGSRFGAVVRMNLAQRGRRVRHTGAGCQAPEAPGVVVPHTGAAAQVTLPDADLAQPAHVVQQHLGAVRGGLGRCCWHRRADRPDSLLAHGLRRRHLQAEHQQLAVPAQADLAQQRRAVGMHTGQWLQAGTGQPRQCSYRQAQQAGQRLAQAGRQHLAGGRHKRRVGAQQRALCIGPGHGHIQQLKGRQIKRGRGGLGRC